LKSLLEYLHSKGVEKLMVEGGGTLISSLISEKLVDEMRIYYAPMIIGGEKSPTICDGKSFNIKCRIVRINRVCKGFSIVIKFD